MRPMYVYPGSFCPPTWGHFQVVKKAAEIFPELTIVCSRNSDKHDNWFSEDECAELWQAYPLPAHVRVTTFSKFDTTGYDLSNVVMVRGIRSDDDYEHEKEVMSLNFRQFRIDKYFFVMSEDGCRDVSSTQARQAAEAVDLKELARCVAPMVVTKLLEHVLDVKHLFMVVGQPGSGKSTFLKMLAEESWLNSHLDTDEINKELRPMVVERFGDNLCDAALHHDEELTRLIGDAWLQRLSERLKAMPTGNNVFVEVPYGLRPGKNIYRFLGGKVLYIGCGSTETMKQRNRDRGTPQLTALIETIPDLATSQQIAEEHQLDLTVMTTDCSLEELKERASNLSRRLNGHGKEDMTMNTSNWNDQNLSWLKQRFCRLIGRLLASPAVTEKPAESPEELAEEIWTQLQQKYSEPHRAYHNWDHLRHCLEELDGIGASSLLDGVEFALWFHDTHYDTHQVSTNNEWLSWQNFALPASRRLSLSETFILKTRSLIVATDHNRRFREKGWVLERLIQDIDISILGRPWPEYLQYEEGIRQEYSWVPEDVFRQNRIEVLANFLRHQKMFGSIYNTSHFREKYEGQAVANLTRAIERLKS